MLNSIKVTSSELRPASSSGCVVVRQQKMLSS